MPPVPLLSPIADTPVAPSAPAGDYAQRTAEAYAYGPGLASPARLALHPVPEGLAYTVVSYWEERLPGQVQRTTLGKTIRLVATRQPTSSLLLTYEAAPPIFQKPDVSSFERVLLLLADLYQRLELRLTPLGQVAQVLNEPAIHQTWARVKAELVRRSGGEDEFTQVLVQGLVEQLRRPGTVLASLRLDYFFGFLLQNVYGQRFETGFRYGQPRCFPQFFAGLDLWFTERLELAVPSGPERVALRLTGQPDPARTNLVAVAEQVAAAQQLLAPAGSDASAAPVLPEALRFAYEASAELDAATGWPVRVEAAVRCWVPGGYSKEYFLRLEQQDPTP